jgi:hypothetical protein
MPGSLRMRRASARKVSQILRKARQRVRTATCRGDERYRSERVPPAIAGRAFGPRGGLAGPAIAAPARSSLRRTHTHALARPSSHPQPSARKHGDIDWRLLEFRSIEAVLENSAVNRTPGRSLAAKFALRPRCFTSRCPCCTESNIKIRYIVKL